MASNDADPSPCQSCGACCAFDADWPRFSTEPDDALDLIPIMLVDPGQSGMGWTGSRCMALSGCVGAHTACTIYDVRPEVCRACEPGDDACTMARAKYGMAAVAVATAFDISPL
jgi:Fe-S-cluster containining protein